ncbi:MAG: hypothetical protein LPK45_06590, partial [Bacteroidota bacterium]|nr:hypothetical protein [Bacteroidota bacterium]MDX5430740.1 hypothetical protein [Bacteroidota bacterium]MDX5469487.1 hypothetical protein [Bacteroidota bacterium]
NVYYWDATQNGTSGNNVGWTAASSTDNQARGYIIYVNNSNNGLHDFTGKLSLSGTNTTGNQVFTLRKFFDPASPSDTSAQGWNFIPNPFPSNLNVTALLASMNFSPGYKAIHAYNYSTGQYEVYCQSGVNVVQYNNTGTDGTIKNLPPYSGFWVKALNDNATFTITNSERTTSMTNVVTLLKKPYDLFRLDVFDGAKGWDQCVVYFKEDGTTGFDNNGDAYKLEGMGGAPVLATLIGNSKLSVNALPISTNQYSLPLHFVSQQEGPCEFKANFTELDEAWTVTLEDKMTGQKFDLRKGAYTFNYVKDLPNRFVIHFEKKASGILGTAPTAFSLRQDREALYLDNPNAETIHLTVYALNGQIIETLEISEAGLQEIQLKESMNHGVFFIRAENASGSQSLKFIR